MPFSVCRFGFPTHQVNAKHRSSRKGTSKNRLNKSRETKLADVDDSDVILIGEDHYRVGDTVSVPSRSQSNSSAVEEATLTGMECESDSVSVRYTSDGADGVLSANTIAHHNKNHAFSYDGTCFKIGQSVLVPPSNDEPSAEAVPAVILGKASTEGQVPVRFSIDGRRGRIHMEHIVDSERERAFRWRGKEYFVGDAVSVPASSVDDTGLGDMEELVRGKIVSAASSNGAVNVRVAQKEVAVALATIGKHNHGRPDRRRTFRSHGQKFRVGDRVVVQQGPIVGEAELASAPDSCDEVLVRKAGSEYAVSTRHLSHRDLPQPKVPFVMDTRQRPVLREMGPRGVVGSGGVGTMAVYRSSFGSDPVTLEKRSRRSSKSMNKPSSVSMCTFDAGGLIDAKDAFSWDGRGKRTIDKDLMAALPPMHHLLEREKKAKGIGLADALVAPVSTRRKPRHRKSRSLNLGRDRSANSALSHACRPGHQRSPSASEMLFADL